MQRVSNLQSQQWIADNEMNGATYFYGELPNSCKCVIGAEDGRAGHKNISNIYQDFVNGDDRTMFIHFIEGALGRHWYPIILKKDERGGGITVQVMDSTDSQNKADDIVNTLKVVQRSRFQYDRTFHSVGKDHGRQNDGWSCGLHTMTNIAIELDRIRGINVSVPGYYEKKYQEYAEIFGRQYDNMHGENTQQNNFYTQDINIFTGIFESLQKNFNQFFHHNSRVGSGAPQVSEVEKDTLKSCTHPFEKDTMAAFNQSFKTQAHSVLYNHILCEILAKRILRKVGDNEYHTLVSGLKNQLEKQGSASFLPLLGMQYKHVDISEAIIEARVNFIIHKDGGKKQNVGWERAYCEYEGGRKKASELYKETKKASQNPMQQPQTQSEYQSLQLPDLQNPQFRRLNGSILDIGNMNFSQAVEAASNAYYDQDLTPRSQRRAKDVVESYYR